MPGRRGRADVKLLGDGLVAAAAGDQRDDLPLTGGQHGRECRSIAWPGCQSGPRRRRHGEVQRQRDGLVTGQAGTLSPQPLDDRLSEAPCGSEVFLGPRSGEGRQLRCPAQGSSGGRELHGLGRLARPDGQRGERLEPAGHPDPGSGELAQPDAFGEMLPGDRELALVKRDARESGQAARDLRPRIDLAQDGQRLQVAVAGAVRIVP